MLPKSHGRVLSNSKIARRWSVVSVPSGTSASCVLFFMCPVGYVLFIVCHLGLGHVPYKKSKTLLCPELVPVSDIWYVASCFLPHTGGHTKILPRLPGPVTALAFVNGASNLLFVTSLDGSVYLADLNKPEDSHMSKTKLPHAAHLVRDTHTHIHTHTHAHAH